MALTDLQCSKFKATGTEYQKADDDGLSLVVSADFGERDRLFR